VAKLRAYHYTAQTKPEKAALARYGLDLVKGVLRNNVEAGVIEPVLAKVKIIQVPPSCPSPAVFEVKK
jgi:T-complex protein 1 subunit alpha